MQAQANIMAASIQLWFSFFFFNAYNGYTDLSDIQTPGK